jgi:hypothetical protein
MLPNDAEAPVNAWNVLYKSTAVDEGYEVRCNSPPVRTQDRETGMLWLFKDSDP